jgi:predicted metal-binding membrane protein
VTAASRAALRTPTSAVVALTAAAAAGLVAWQLSPARHLLGHESGDTVPDGPAMLAWFTLSWLLMTMATMLPTSLPLVSAFSRLTAARPDGRRLVTTLVATYLSVWIAVGFVLATLDTWVHTLTRRTALADHTPLVLAATFVLAGAYQLSHRSAACLRACRAPLSFLAVRWSGRGSATGRAVAVGIDYGLSCVGCCAALMLVMFAVGMASPLVMIGLGAVAAAHKLAPWGATLARATGIVLLLAGFALGAAHLIGGG